MILPCSLPLMISACALSSWRFRSIVGVEANPRATRHWTPAAAAHIHQLRGLQYHLKTGNLASVGPLLRRVPGTMLHAGKLLENAISLRLERGFGRWVVSLLFGGSERCMAVKSLGCQYAIGRVRIVSRGASNYAGLGMGSSVRVQTRSGVAILQQWVG